MCYVVITTRSLAWTLLTIATAVAMIAAVITPKWMIGRRHKLGLESMRNETTYKVTTSDEFFTPTIGIFNRCTKLQRYGKVYSDNCASFVTGFDMHPEDFPNYWKASLVFFAAAGVMLVFTVVTATFSLCVRSMCGKSIFTLSGLIQSISGLLCILALLLYPAGWGSQRLKELCGPKASAYSIDECSLGWAFYLCIVGTLLVFLCSVLSIQAESSTSSQKVEEEILEGKNLICVV